MTGNIDKAYKCRRAWKREMWLQGSRRPIYPPKIFILHWSCCQSGEVSLMERVSTVRHLHCLAPLEPKKKMVYIDWQILFFGRGAQQVSFTSCWPKISGERRKRNFIYIEINNHWKPSVWAHSNVIYDVIHHFYREKTFSCLSLPLSQREPVSLWASSSFLPVPGAVIGQGLFVSFVADASRNWTTEPNSRPKARPPPSHSTTHAGILEEIREKVPAKRDVNFQRTDSNDAPTPNTPSTTPTYPAMSASIQAHRSQLFPRLMLMKCMRMKYGKLQIALAKNPKRNCKWCLRCSRFPFDFVWNLWWRAIQARFLDPPELKWRNIGQWLTLFPSRTLISAWQWLWDTNLNDLIRFGFMNRSVSYS